MNVGIRRVGYGVVVLLLVVVAQLTWLQVVDAKKLADNGNNPRKIFEQFNSPRGEIVSADAKVLARLDRREGRVRQAAASTRSASSPPSSSATSRSPSAAPASRPRTTTCCSARDVHHRAPGRGRLPQGQASASATSSPACASTRSRRRRTCSGPLKGSVVVIRAGDGRDRGDVLQPELRPQPAGVAQREGRAGVLRPAERRPQQAVAAARVPRDLSARLHVQDGDDDGEHRQHPWRHPSRRSRAARRSSHPRPASRSRTSAASGAAARSSSRSSSRATSRSPGSVSSSARSSRRRCRSSASTSNRPSTSQPGRGRQHRPAAGHVREQQAASSRSPASGRATWPRRRCRWRSSRRASRTRA